MAHRKSAKVNAVIVFVKSGYRFVIYRHRLEVYQPCATHTPYLIPDNAPPVPLGGGKVYDYSPAVNHGWLGVLRGAAVVFIAVIGLDAV